MKNIFLVITSLFSTTLYCQYYYNDIVDTQEINNRIKTYVAAKVQSVTETGLDAQGRKTTDFNEWQDMQTAESMLKIPSRNGQSVTRLYYTFDDKARLI